MKQYYECHVTLLGDPEEIKKALGRHVSPYWAFSCIDGDIDLGGGVKCYLTRQFNHRVQTVKMITMMWEIGNHIVELSGAKILRLKVEDVIYDERIS